MMHFLRTLACKLSARLRAKPSMSMFREQPKHGHFSYSSAEALTFFSKSICIKTDPEKIVIQKNR